MLATYLKRQTNRATCYFAVRSARIWTISLTGDDECDGSANAQTRTIPGAGQTHCFPARCIEYAECLEPRSLCPSALSVITLHFPELRISPKVNFRSEQHRSRLIFRLPSKGRFLEDSIFCYRGTLQETECDVC
jgi:hypothetical protein